MNAHASHPSASGGVSDSRDGASGSRNRASGTRGSRSRPRGLGRPRSLSTRLLAGVLLLLSVVLLAFGVAVTAATQQDLSARLDDSVRQTMGRAVSYTQPGNSAQSSPQEQSGNGASTADGEDPDPLDAPGQPAGALTVVWQDGRITGASYRSESGEDRDVPEEDIAALRSVAQAAVDQGTVSTRAPDTAAVSGAGASSDTSASTSAGDSSERRLGELATVDLSVGQYRVEVISPGQEQGSGERLLVAGLPTSSVTQTMRGLVTTMLIGGLLSLAVTAVMGTLWVRRTLRPLHRVSNAAQTVAGLPLQSGEVSLRERRVSGELAVQGTEVGEVGFALNALLDNVDSALDARYKSESKLRRFVADASHELRTPLASIRGYTDMLRLTEPLTEEGESKLGRIEQQTERMTALVEDLLLLARLDEGHTPEMREIDVSELVLDALTDASAAGPDHEWSVDLPDEPVPVLGQADQLNQVLTNLLSNARKHTPSGTSVRADVAVGEAAGVAGLTAESISSTDSGQPWALITVSDDGPGIPEDFQDRLFERFSRLDTSRLSREGSTGLGLSLVRSIVEAHGGTVGVESRPGRTVFTVRLPLARTWATPPGDLRRF